MARTSYFKNCTTIEELKKEYKRLMLLYHPDINPEGLTKAQEINAEYDEMFPRLKDVHKTAEGKEYK
jgi:DnaJ-class molecular chaperone